jgi:hypothetical protein
MNYASPGQVMGAKVWCLAQDGMGKIWAGGVGGLARFEGDRWI